MRRRVLGLLAGSVLTSAVALAGGGAGAVGVATSASGGGGLAPLARLVSHVSYPTPPTTADCEQQIGVACYSPQQFQTAYDMAPLYKKGLDGTGQTIVIVDSFGYPRIKGELKTFDSSFGLQAPPSFRIIQPAGKVPPYNTTKNPMMEGWALETSLDVEYSHAMAPGANILLVETPNAETLGVHGFPPIVAAEKYVIQHHLGNVITQSFAAPEATFASPKDILKLRGANIAAQKAGVSMLAAAGDAGASAPKTLDSQGFAATYFTRPVTSWPATDPLVTAVGGTQLHLDADGNHTQPDTVWNDTNLFDSPSAGGGGHSTVFARPSYQNGVAATVGSTRGVPDISMSAAVDGSALVYLDGKTGFGTAGFYLVGGTSEASPEFSGVVAIADQLAGHGLGLLNPALYSMLAHHEPGIVDVTAGTNTVTFPQGSTTHTVRGWDAVKGYDLSSGVGTIDGAKFVPELVAAASSS